MSVFVHFFIDSVETFGLRDGWMDIGRLHLWRQGKHHLVLVNLEVLGIVLLYFVYSLGMIWLKVVNSGLIVLLLG